MAAYEVIVTMYKQSIFFGNAAYKVGMWYAKRLNYTDALRCFKMGRTYDPNGAEGSRTQFQIGMVWKHTAENDSGEAVDKNYKEAIKQFSEVVKSWPGSKEADQANYQIADCNVKIGNEKAAKEAVKKIQKRDLVLNAMKLFGVAGDNAEEEVKYWQLQYKDGLEDEERATALYEQAMVLSDKLKKYDEAAIAFNRVLELSKEDQKRINANVGLARIYTSQAKFADAESVYVVLFKNKKVSPELNQQLQIQLYDIFFKEKRYDTAYAEFQNYVTLYPEHPLTPYAYYRMGLVLAEQKKNQEALNTFQIILDRWTIENSVYDKAVLGIGEQMVALGRYQQAADYLEKFVKANPGVSVAVNMYLKIIEVYNKYLDNKDKALALLEYVSANFPDDPLFSYVSYQYGMMLKEKGDEPKAVSVFEKVKKEESSLFRASQAEIGKIVAKTDPAAAIEHYRLIVAQCETPEDSTIALMGIGDVYVTVQNWDSAAAVFKGVYDNFNGRDSTLRAGALIKQIDALVNGKKYKEAIVVAELMQKYFADNPYTVNAIYFEANSYFALQNFSKAREAFQKIITLNRNEQLSEIAAYQKSECIYFAKQYPEAIREYADYLKKYPEGRYRPRALFMQGNSYWQLQEFGTAREKFAEVVAKYPQFEELCTAKNLLAFCLNKIGKWKEAVALYNEVRSKGSCAKTAITWANEQREAIISAH